MSEKDKSGDNIRADISNVSGGQVAVGKGITQSTSASVPEGISTAEFEELKKLLADLRKQVETEAPEEEKPAALERVKELEEAVTADKPDLTTMEYVKKWFEKRIPSIAGTVSSVVINPIVEKSANAAGDALASEFRRRFVRK